MRHAQSPSVGAQPRRRSRTKHRAILAAAAALVVEHGYHPVTIEQVAARAGVGKQTIYRWWASKPSLLLEVYADLVPDTVPETVAAPVGAGLVAFLEGVFRLYAETPAALILCGLIGDAQKDAGTHAVLRDGLVAGRGRHLVALFERASARGELPLAFDPAWAIDMIVAMIWRRLLCEREAPDSKFARRLSETVLRAQGAEAWEGVP